MVSQHFRGGAGRSVVQGPQGVWDHSAIKASLSQNQNTTVTIKNSATVAKDRTVFGKNVSPAFVRLWFQSRGPQGDHNDQIKVEQSFCRLCVSCCAQESEDKPGLPQFGGSTQLGLEEHSR